MTTRRHTLGSSILGYPAIVWLLGLGSLVNITGLSLLWPVNAIYIHIHLGQPLTVSGFVLMLYSGAGFIGSILSGWLYDRVGAIPVLGIGMASSAVIICIPAIWPGWWTYVAVMGAFGVTCALPFPAFSAVLGHVWPTGGRRGYNFLYVTNNVGVALGTALGGVLAQVSFHIVFYSIAVSYAVAFALVLGILRPRLAQAHRAHALTTVPSPTGFVPEQTIPWLTLAAVLVGFLLGWAIYVQWQSTISVYMIRLGYPTSLYSILWTVNGLGVFLAQPLVSRVTRRFPSLWAHMVLGVGMFAVAYSLLLTSQSYWAFVAAMIALTLGEIFVWPAIPTAVAQLAPPQRLGFVLGLVGAAATLGRMIGPVVGGVLYDRAPMRVVLLTWMVGTALPISAFLVYRFRQRAADTVAGPSVAL